MQDSLDAANERGPGCLFQDLTQEVIKWQLIHLDISGSALTFLQFECLALTPDKLWILRIVIFFYSSTIPEAMWRSSLTGLVSTTAGEALRYICNCRVPVIPYLPGPRVGSFVVSTVPTWPWPGSKSGSRYYSKVTYSIF